MKQSLLAAILMGISLSLAGCSAKSDDAGSHQAAAAEGEHARHAAMDVETAEPSEGSLYHVSSIWKDRNGKELQLESLRGEVQVVAMAYTSCDYACPKIVGDMQEIKDGLPAEIRSATNFVLVSIDPERDTPDRLKQFASENNLDENQWTLLNGEKGDILELAALLGFRYQRISDTDFSHSNMITVLNREGEIVHQRKQLQDRQNDITAAITQAAE